MLNISSRNLQHFDDRAAGSQVDTIVIHSLYAQAYPDKVGIQNCFDVLDQCKVSAHYLISREGEIWNLVPEDKRAWHAGVSKMCFEGDQRESVNHFSIGIELIATEESGFTPEQYEALGLLTADIVSRHEIKNIVGHEHIAPGRKIDPGPNFDWPRYRALVEAGLPPAANINFPR